MQTECRFYGEYEGQDGDRAEGCTVYLCPCETCDLLLDACRNDAEEELIAREHGIRDD